MKYLTLIQHIQVSHKLHVLYCQTAWFTLNYPSELSHESLCRILFLLSDVVSSGVGYVCINWLVHTNKVNLAAYTILTNYRIEGYICFDLHNTFFSLVLLCSFGFVPCYLCHFLIVSALRSGTYLCVVISAQLSVLYSRISIFLIIIIMHFFKHFSHSLSD